MGTGLNTRIGFAEKIAEHIANYTGEIIYMYMYKHSDTEYVLVLLLCFDGNCFPGIT